MIVLLCMTGLLLVAISGRFAAHAIALPRLQLRRHLDNLNDYGFSAEEPSGAASQRGRLNDSIAGFAERVGTWAIQNISALPPLRRGALAAAGYYELSPEAVHGYRLVAAVFLGALFALAGFTMGGVSLITVLLVAVAVVGGWQLPAVVIRSRGRRRLAQIDKELPELIDLLIATVEAGLAFGASLALAADRVRGELGDEVRLTVRQQNLGISTSQALEDMLERCDSPSMRSFVRTVTRGQEMGMSIAPILRELATDMRRRRRQAALERMHKAPVKILFPLMFLIMPALMIVLFYPALYSIINGLSGLG